MTRKLLTLILMLGAALLVACGGTSNNNAEPAAAPTESPPESEADTAGAAVQAGDAHAESDSAGQPKFIEFYAEW